MAELSAYELKRAENIARNQAKLRALSLAKMGREFSELAETERQSRGRKQLTDEEKAENKRKREERRAGPRRQSVRIKEAEANRPEEKTSVVGVAWGVTCGVAPRVRLTVRNLGMLNANVDVESGRVLVPRFYAAEGELWGEPLKVWVDGDGRHFVKWGVRQPKLLFAPVTTPADEATSATDECNAVPVPGSIEGGLGQVSTEVYPDCAARRAATRAVACIARERVRRGPPPHTVREVDPPPLEVSAFSMASAVAMPPQAASPLPRAVATSPQSTSPPMNPAVAATTAAAAAAAARAAMETSMRAQAPVTVPIPGGSFSPALAPAALGLMASPPQPAQVASPAAPAPFAVLPQPASTLPELAGFGVPRLGWAGQGGAGAPPPGLAGQPLLGLGLGGQPPLSLRGVPPSGLGGQPLAPWPGASVALPGGFPNQQQLLMTAYQQQLLVRANGGQPPLVPALPPAAPPLYMSSQAGMQQPARYGAGSGQMPFQPPPSPPPSPPRGLAPAVDQGGALMDTDADAGGAAGESDQACAGVPAAGACAGAMAAITRQSATVPSALGGAAVAELTTTSWYGRAHAGVELGSEQQELMAAARVEARSDVQHRAAAGSFKPRLAGIAPKWGTMAQRFAGVTVTPSATPVSLMPPAMPQSLPQPTFAPAPAPTPQVPPPLTVAQRAEIVTIGHATKATAENQPPLDADGKVLLEALDGWGIFGYADKAVQAELIAKHLGVWEDESSIDPQALDALLGEGKRKRGRRSKADGLAATVAADMRRSEGECVLCGHPATTNSELMQVDGFHVHQVCALWSPEVYCQGSRMAGVTDAVLRGSQIACARCGDVGATIACREPSCGRNFHLGCLVTSGGAINLRHFSVACKLHRTAEDVEGVADPEPVLNGLAAMAGTEGDELASGAGGAASAGTPIGESQAAVEAQQQQQQQQQAKDQAQTEPAAPAQVAQGGSTQTTASPSSPAAQASQEGNATVSLPAAPAQATEERDNGHGQPSVVLRPTTAPTQEPHGTATEAPAQEAQKAAASAPPPAAGLAAALLSTAATGESAPQGAGDAGGSGAAHPPSDAPAAAAATTVAADASGGNGGTGGDSGAPQGVVGGLGDAPAQPVAVLAEAAAAADTAAGRGANNDASDDPVAALTKFQAVNGALQGHPCILCGIEGDHARPVYAIEGMHAHLECALWSPECHWSNTPGEPGAPPTIVGLSEAVERAKGLICRVCRRPGATLQCRLSKGYDGRGQPRRCGARFHLACLLASGGSVRPSDWTVTCHPHSSRADRECTAALVAGLEPELAEAWAPTVLANYRAEAERKKKVERPSRGAKRVLMADSDSDHGGSGLSDSDFEVSDEDDDAYKPKRAGGRAARSKPKARSNTRRSGRKRRRKGGDGAVADGPPVCLACAHGRHKAHERRDPACKRYDPALAAAAAAEAASEGEDDSDFEAAPVAAAAEAAPAVELIAAPEGAVCALCGGGADAAADRNVVIADGVTVHEDCAVWCPQAYYGVAGQLVGVAAEVRRAARLRCAHCGEPGAAVGCHCKACNKSFHLGCVEPSGGVLNVGDYSARCEQHATRAMRAAAERAAAEAAAVLEAQEAAKAAEAAATEAAEVAEGQEAAPVQEDQPTGEQSAAGAPVVAQAATPAAVKSPSAAKSPSVAKSPSAAKLSAGGIGDGTPRCMACARKKHVKHDRRDPRCRQHDPALAVTGAGADAK